MQNIENGSTAETVFGTEHFCGSVAIAIPAKSKKKGKDNMPARFLVVLKKMCKPPLSDEIK